MVGMPLVSTSRDWCAEVQELFDRSALLRERSRAIAENMADLAARVKRQRNARLSNVLPGTSPGSGI
jgi:hypothetical protein